MPRLAGSLVLAALLLPASLRAQGAVQGAVPRALDPARALPQADVVADRDRDGRPDHLGDTVVVAGRASMDGTALYPDRLNLWLQDATGGIKLYEHARPPRIVEGDSIVARGVVSMFLGAVELRVDTFAVIPAPRRVLQPEPVVLRESAMARHANRLATLEGRLVAWGSDASGLYAVLENPQGRDRVALFVATPQLAAMEMTRYGLQDRLRVTGVLVPFVPEVQQPGNALRVDWRIVPRGPRDVQRLGMGATFRSAVRLAVPLALVAALALAMVAVLVLRRDVRRKTRRLLESEQRYRSLHDYNPDPVCSFDLAGNLRSANSAFGALVGQPIGDLLGGSLLRITLEPFVEATRQHFAAAAEGRPRHFETRIRTHAGGERALGVTFLPIVVNGEITGVFGLAKDVTARADAQRAVEEAARLLSSVVETQQVIASSELDVHAVARRILEQVSRLTAADLAEIAFVEGEEVVVRPHMRSREVDVGTVRVPLAGSFAALALASGQVVRSDDVRGDARLRGSGPSVLGFGSLLVVPLVYGGTAVGVLAVSSSRAHAFSGDDERTLRLLAGLLAAALSHAREFEAKQELVAERTAALEALQASEERFRRILERASDPVSIIGPDGTYVWVSPASERVLGYPAESMLGTSGFEYVHPEDAPAVAATLAEVVATPGSTGRSEYRYRHADGTWRVHATVGCNMLADPAVRGIVLNSRDVTEQRGLEEQLRHAQKMEAVGQLAGGVAHDFNNLLTVIRVHSAFLLDALADRDPRRADAEEIQRAGDRAAALTKQLLAFSRRQLLQPRVLDLNASVTGVEPMLRRLIGEDISIVTRLAPRLGQITADPGQLEQVLMNLAVNARDAMPHGGTLTVETSNVVVTDADPLARELAPGRYAQLAVGDTGVGMDAVTLERVFEPFFTTKEQGKGTGLGLATVYGVVQQSGGAVRVESEPGVGSVFRIYLPAVTEGKETEAAPAAPDAPAGGTETILIAEDEDAVRSLARRILGARGYRIIEGRNGRDALEAARAAGGEIHLVLTDVVMPEMGGRELAEAIGAERPDTRILFMSGYTDDDILRRGLHAPGVAFLHKPFTVRELTETVRRVLDAVPAGA